MFEVNIAVLLVVCLIVLVAIGVHIAIALGMTSALGIWSVTGADANAFRTVQAMLAATAYEAIRDYVFAVIPLFLLMGEFIGKSGTITDIYRGINKGLKKIPGRLAIATVIGNALFSFVTGVSIASAAAFSRIAYPEMRRYNYHRGFALGTIAGSSCLGMLIPPSVLMIVWGILTEKSIGQIFAAGVFPGLLLMVLFIIYVFSMALIKPELVGAGTATPVETGPDEDIDDDVSTGQFISSLIGILIVIAAVLGGIVFGVFTPTEGAGAGAFIGLVLGLLKGMRYKDIIDSILSVGRTSAPILLLLVTAALYSRTLAMTGLANAIESLFIGSGMDPWMVISVMVIIWFLLGMIIDSISIMLLTAAIFSPIAEKLGYDP
ncbi:MAG: TRAP transporter large permease subunit, partial [Rhodospirillales bacterium]